MDIKQEIQSLSPTAIIELFEVDTRMFNGGALFYFHSGISQTNNPIVWRGVKYDPIPLQSSGFDLTTQGSLPRPTLKIANVGGVISAMTLRFDDLVGAKVVRRRTFARYLDAVNFPNGNPDANPDQYLADQLWYIDVKKAENREYVEFELASAFDLDGIKLPLRQIVKNTCCWRYRSADCGYTGAYFDAMDKPTSDQSKDFCNKRFSSCRTRFYEGYKYANTVGMPEADRNRIKMIEDTGAGWSGDTERPLPFGGFPGAERGD